MAKYVIVFVLASILSFPLMAQETPPALEPITADNMEQVTLLYTIELGEGSLQAIAFSPDDALIATLMKRRQTVELWNANTGEHYDTLDGHEGYVLDINFSPDGRLIASGAADETVRIWNATTGDEVLVLDGHVDVADRVIFSPDGMMLASSDGYSVYLWNVTTGEQLIVIPVSQSNVLVADIAFSSDGSRLAVLDVGAGIELWDTKTLTRGLSFEATDYNIADPVPINLTFSPDGRFIVVADWMESGHVWDISQTPPLASRLPNLRYTEIIDRGQYIHLLPYLTDEEKIQIVDIQTQDILTTFEFMTTRELPETFSPDATIYITHSSAVVLWNISTGGVTWDSQFDSALFSPSGRHLASWNSMSDEVDVAIAGVPRSTD